MQPLLERARWRTLAQKTAKAARFVLGPDLFAPNLRTAEAPRRRAHSACLSRVPLRTNGLQGRFVRGITASSYLIQDYLSCSRSGGGAPQETVHYRITWKRIGTLWKGFSCSLHGLEACTSTRLLRTSKYLTTSLFAVDYEGSYAGTPRYSEAPFGLSIAPSKSEYSAETVHEWR
jgi:hypothetical protein